MGCGLNYHDKLGVSHVRMRQAYNGLPVFAADLVIHVADGQVAAVNGVYPDSINLSTEPELTAAEAYKIAVAELELNEPVLESKELVIYNTGILDPLADGENHLTYQLVIETQNPADSLTVLVDAQTGKVLHHYTNWPAARDREVYNRWGDLIYNESGPVVSSPSQEATNAYNFTGETYDYYWNTFGRDSFDDQGATMIAHVEYYMHNAVWTGTSTQFGSGYATKDVVAHEWTHAVTQYTADLVYSDQPGALNEAMSDIFSCMVDRDDWLEGEDLPGGTIRVLSDPAMLGDPGKVSEYVVTNRDNGGVHINSTIVSHAAYLMAEGGSYNGFTISGIGRERTEQIFYRALTVYLTRGSDFIDAYYAILAAASDLYGTGSDVYNNVTLALQAVELDQPVGADRPEAGVPDSFEDDDDAAAASAWEDEQSHNFHVASDSDYVKFSATTNTTYVIETSNLGSRCDTTLYLYDTDGGTEVTRNYDGGSGLASRIVWTAPADGIYYILVRHFLPGTYGVNTEYDLAVTSGTGADVYEPDDTFSQATDIGTPPPGVIAILRSHNFHVAGDNDWISFGATAGNDYIIETTNLGSASDTYMYLYDTNGTTEITHDDDGGDGLASRIEWTAPASGTYYIRIRHYSALVYGPDTSYDLQLQCIASEGPKGPELMPEPKVTFKLPSELAHTGDILEMTILLNSSVSAVKIESLTKPSQLSLVEVSPVLPKTAAITPEMKEDSFFLRSGEMGEGPLSFWYSSKMARAAGADCPELLLRWKVTAQPPAGKLYIKLGVTPQGHDGQVQDTIYVKYGVALLGKEPKIYDVQPRSFYNNADKAISITGSDFEDTPKVYLMGTQGTIPLTNVTFWNSGVVWATVPQGTKAGTYKLRLDNSSNSAEFAGITVLQNSPPTLSDGAVSPASGYTSDNFTYSVNYTDADNHPPSSITVTIGGASANMTARAGQDGDFTNGEIYEYSISGASLGIGTHSFQFAASDGMDSATGDTGSHSGPAISSPPAPAPARGGENGGGGGLPAGFTSLGEYITLGGRLNRDISAASSDKKIKLFLSEGTIAKNRAGSLVTSLRITEMKDQPASPPDSTVIGLVYDIQPSGATFDPPATITFAYDDSDIPQGVSEKNLIIATWDGEEWVYLECSVDPEANTISAKISHLSIYAIVAGTRPAAFTVAELSITPQEVTSGVDVNITVLISNTGDLTASYEAILKIDNAIAQTKEITLDGGDSRTVSFSMRAGTAGEHTVSIGDLVGTFKVKTLEVPPAPITAAAPPNFITSDLSVTPRVAELGEQITISVVVSNTGGTEGSYDVVLEIDGAQEAVATIILGAGESKSVTFTVAKGKEGVHFVDVGGRVAQFTVVAPPPPAPAPVEPLPLQSPTNWWLIGSMLGGVVAAGLIYYFMLRERMKIKGISFRKK